MMQSDLFEQFDFCWRDCVAVETYLRSTHPRPPAYHRYNSKLRNLGQNRQREQKNFEGGNLFSGETDLLKT